MDFTLTSSSFADGATIPRLHTCEDEGVSPELEWEGFHETTRSFALIMHDPDTPKGDVTHWMIWDLASSTTSLAENAGSKSSATVGANEHGEEKYLPPTPPRGDPPHRYIFTLYALDVARLGLDRGSKRATVQTAVEQHALAKATLIGKFGRK